MDVQEYRVAIPVQDMECERIEKEACNIVEKWQENLARQNKPMFELAVSITTIGDFTNENFLVCSCSFSLDKESGWGQEGLSCDEESHDFGIYLAVSFNRTKFLKLDAEDRQEIVERDFSWNLAEISCDSRW